MTVYGDLLFLINFSMDFLCFYISCMLLRRPLPLLRAVLASMIGGAYSVMALFLNVGGVAALTLDILCCLAMCGIVFLNKGSGFGVAIKGSAVYFLASILLGGVMTALYSMLNRSEIFSGSPDAEDGISVWVFAILATLGGGASAFGGRLFRASARREDAALEISDGKNKVTLRALSDSGNLASDPISGRAVIVATLSSSEAVIPKEIYPVFDDPSNIDSIPVSAASKIRLIPAGTVAGDKLLPAIKMKSIKIKRGKREKDVDALIAFVKRDSFDGYDAVIPCDILI